MATLADGYDVVVPAVGNLLEPLHAVYRKAIIQVIEDRIRQDDQRIRNMFGVLRVRYVQKEEIERFDPERKSFKNLNTPQDYEEAVCAELECKT